MEPKKELINTQLTLAINDLIENIQDTFKKLIRHEVDHLHLAINNLLEAWLEFTRRVLLNPDRMAHAQLVYWQDYLLLCKDLQQRLVDASATKSPLNAQKQKVLLAFIDKYSFLVAQHVHVVIKNIFTTVDGEDTRKIEFFTRQFTESFAAQSKYQKVLGNLA
ncbi:MAG: hypothetical protein V4501_02540 [Pseudomonadota bacterium]